MRQVIFRLPIHTSWSPDGIPIYGYGLMLFVAFLACTWLAGRLAKREGINKEHILDLALWLFVGGLIGSRVVFMIQYNQPLSRFFFIWEGGLVFYGGLAGAAIAYLVAHKRIIVRHGLSGWKVADVVAPCAALGLALGRIGCLLNGCCYGEVACPDCLPPALQAHFPLSGMPRARLVERGYQTAAGFTTRDNEPDDPRTVVLAVESGSEADQAGLKAGDLIVGVDGRPNQIIVRLEARERGKAEEGLRRLVGTLRERGHTASIEEENADESPTFRVAYDTADDYHKDAKLIRDTLLKEPPVYDTFNEYMVERWPRGKNDLQLTVQRGGERVDLPAFAPRTLGLYPTQLFETISTGLLCLLLLAYQPFRRHDGELMALFLVLYPIHRFLNEILRDDTEPVQFGMTLSQNGSILVFAVGVVMLLWLRRMPAQYHPWKQQAPLKV